MQLVDVKALVERQAHAWEQGEIDLALSDFAADALFIAPGGRCQGHEEIRDLANAFFETTLNVCVEIKSVLAMSPDGERGFANAQGAIEWTWRETRRATGERHEAEDAIIFELRDGKIVYWREYFDTEQMEKPR